jgi:hypothetical protein
MATTWIKPLKVRKDRSIIKSLTGRTMYASNELKTDGGLLVKGYACNPRTVDEEFMFTKRDYEFITGRDNGLKNVIAYHFRQSFKPGEVTPEEALEVGYETAMRWTKGNHAFIVCVHTDTKHLHCAIVYNSTRLDGTGKFNNFKNSSFAVRRLSDLVCAEHGLSVIENPKQSKGKNYAEWLGGKEPTWREKLRRQIDEVVSSCPTFADFVAAMRAAGFVVNDKRKYITLLAPGQKRALRLSSLGEGYTEAEIRERLGMTRTVAGSGAGGQKEATTVRYVIEPRRVSLLIDIQAKIREGKGEGYERWARIFNLKESARTLLFLKENGIDSYDDLVKKAAEASADFDRRMTNIKAAEKRLAEITELQKHIGTYTKTREIYAKYKVSGWNSDFYETHRAEITLHRAAKKHFDTLKLKKLPTIATLKQEFAELSAEKKKLYNGYHEAKDNVRQLLVAKGNAARILGIDQDAQERERSRAQSRSVAHDR